MERYEKHHTGDYTCKECGAVVAAQYIPEHERFHEKMETLAPDAHLGRLAYENVLERAEQEALTFPIRTAVETSEAS